MSNFNLFHKFAERGDHTLSDTHSRFKNTHQLILLLLHCCITAVSVCLCVQIGLFIFALPLSYFFFNLLIFSICLHFLLSTLKHTRVFFPMFTVLVFLPSPIPSIWLLPRFMSIDFLPTCPSLLLACLPVVPIPPLCLSTCLPSSRSASVFRLHLLLFLFLSSCLCACTGNDSVSLSSSPLSSTPPPRPTHHTHKHTHTRSSSPSDNVDHYPAIWIYWETVAAMTCKIGLSLKRHFGTSAQQTGTGFTKDNPVKGRAIRMWQRFFFFHY